MDPHEKPLQKLYKELARDAQELKRRGLDRRIKAALWAAGIIALACLMSPDFREAFLNGAR